MVGTPNFCYCLAVLKYRDFKIFFHFKFTFYRLIKSKSVWGFLIYCLLSIISVNLKHPRSFSTVLIQLVRKVMFSRRAFLDKVVSDKFVTRCQKLISNLKPFKERGISPVSPYTARLGQDFDTPRMYFRNLRCSMSAFVSDIYFEKRSSAKFLDFFVRKCYPIFCIVQHNWRYEKA